MAAQVIDGVTAPSGGFQQGGWYSGRQYWNGTLSAPGVINSQSDQQGAGQKVSNEVVAQTNPNNVAYIQSQNPSSSGAVTPYLNDYQNGLQNSAGAPPVRIDTMESLKAKLEPAGGAPETINRVEMLDQKRAEYGVASLEQAVNDYKAQEDELNATLRARTHAEEGKPVALNVIAGRITEEQRQTQDQLEYLGRQKSRAIDQLNTSYNIINQYINFAGLDYADAAAKYNSEFDRNFQMYDVIMKQEDAARTESYRQQQVASANLTTMMNLVTSGNLNYAALPDDQKLMINKLEMQSGIPVGTMSNLKLNPKDSIVFQNTNNGITQLGIRNADGSISVQEYGTKTGGATTKEQTTQSYKNDVAQYARSGATLGEVLRTTNGVISNQDAYEIYNANSIYGADKSDKDTLERYGIKITGD